MTLLDDTKHMNAMSSSIEYETFEAEAHCRVDTLFFKLKSNLKFMKGRVTRDMIPARNTLKPQPKTVYGRLNDALIQLS
jgi:hypothetical protein